MAYCYSSPLHLHRSYTAIETLLEVTLEDNVIKVEPLALSRVDTVAEWSYNPDMRVKIAVFNIIVAQSNLS